LKCQFCTFFSIKLRKFWHTARLSRTNRHKVIKSEKQSGFFAHPVYSHGRLLEVPYHRTRRALGNQPDLWARCSRIFRQIPGKKKRALRHRVQIASWFRHVIHAVSGDLVMHAWCSCIFHGRATPWPVTDILPHVPVVPLNVISDDTKELWLWPVMAHVRHRRRPWTPIKSHNEKWTLHCSYRPILDSDRRIVDEVHRPAFTARRYAIAQYMIGIGYTGSQNNPGTTF